VSHCTGASNTSEDQQEREQQHRHHPAHRSERGQDQPLEGPGHELLPQARGRRLERRVDHLEEDQPDQRERVVLVVRGELRHLHEPRDVIEERQAEEDAQKDRAEAQAVADEDLEVALHHRHAGVEHVRRQRHEATSFPDSIT
jgi:hypothetical protein